MQGPQYIDDGISLRDLIGKILFMFRELLKQWKWILITCVIMVVLAWFYVSSRDDRYLATTTFMLANAGSSGLSPYLSMAFQLGVVPIPNLDERKMLTILESQRVIKSALMTEVVIGEEKDFLANHYIDIYKMHDRWKKIKELKDFYFIHDFNNLNRTEQGALNSIYGTVSKDLMNIDNSRDGIMSVTVLSIDEEFSKYLTDFMIDAVTEYYVSHATQRGRETVNVLEAREDSVKSALAVAEIVWARWKDQSHGLVFDQAKVQEVKLRRNMEVLSTMYKEIVKNLEVARFNLLNETPIVQIIDSPKFPLPLLQMGYIKMLVIAIFLGGVLSSGVVIVRRIVLDALK
ncbi:MAG: hypothetical protein IIA45_07155 [Bacteroidetes bacterium]|nr:hypothetical protein [Bacteroidota bacterium]